MKTLRHFLATSILSLPLVSAVTVDPTSSLNLVKKTEIKPENAKDGIQKMIKSGFIKSVGRKNKDEAVRALKSNQPHPKPPRHEPATHNTRTKNQTPQAQKKKTATTRHEHDDEWYDDYFVYHDDEYIDLMAELQAMLEQQQQVQAVGGNDDDDVHVNHETGKRGKKGTKSSKKSKSSKKGKKGGLSDSDEDGEEAAFVGELVYSIEAFMDTRGLPTPSVYADASDPNPIGAGNVNIYTDTLLWELDAIGASALIGLVQGTCTRTDVNDNGSNINYEGRGWCSLTFEALIGTDQGQEVVASFTAAGSVSNHNSTDESTILTITGGLGQFAGISGEIYLDTATLNSDVSPPEAVYDPSVDFLSSPDGYIMFGFLYSDVRIDMLETGVGDDIAMVGDDFIGGGGDGDVDDDSIVESTSDPMATNDPSDLIDGEVVLCPGVTQDDFCDCASDCINFPDTRCVCSEAQSCCRASGFA